MHADAIKIMGLFCKLAMATHAFTTQGIVHQGHLLELLRTIFVGDILHSVEQKYI
jgi:hypothetical protein